MRNYCYKVSKNGWRSQDKIDTITGIHVYELNKTKHDTELCEKGVMCEVYEEGTFYDEHDEFYFQAKNTVKASKIGFSHYINRDLQKLGDKNVRLFLLDNSISFDDAMALSESEAYKKCKEYYERLVKK